MSLRKYYGIKFPFKNKSIDNNYIDLDLNEGDSIKSQLMHLIFTPIGQRLRKPMFGSRLIQYIFSPNDRQTMDDVITEIRDMIRKNIPNCNLTNIVVGETDNGSGYIIDIYYSLSENGETNNYKITTKI